MFSRGHRLKKVQGKMLENSGEAKENTHILNNDTGEINFRRKANETQI